MGIGLNYPFFVANIAFCYSLFLEQHYTLSEGKHNNNIVFACDKDNFSGMESSSLSAP